MNVVVTKTPTMRKPEGLARMIIVVGVFAGDNCCLLKADSRFAKS